MVAVEVTKFVIVIISLLLSPLGDSGDSYIDVVGLEDDDIESLYVKLKDDQVTVDCFELQQEEEEFIFSIEKKRNSKFMIIVDENEVDVDLNKFLSKENIDRLKKNKETYYTIEISNGDDLMILNVGDVTYLRTKEFEDIIFVIHE